MIKITAHFDVRQFRSRADPSFLLCTILRPEMSLSQYIGGPKIQLYTIFVYLLDLTVSAATWRKADTPSIEYIKM